MQSENGILLLFYTFLSNGNEKKTLRGKGVKRGDAVSCPLAPGLSGKRDEIIQIFY